MVLIVEKEITLSLLFSLVAVSLHIRTHTLTRLHILEHRPTYTHTHIHIYVYTHMHSQARTCTHMCTHHLVPTNAAQLIFCFEDCFLNQIKVFQPTEEQRPSALELGGRTRSRRPAGVTQ